MQYIEAQRANGGRLIVVDPRNSTTSKNAALHLRLIPGSDAALANGLLHILLATGEPVENACQGLKVYTVRVDDNGDVLQALE